MSRFVAAILVAHLLGTLSCAVTIDTVFIGDAGNVPDLTFVDSIGPVGNVAYEYRIGTYEVTNAQYIEFLNAKAATDPLALYDTRMASLPTGGIIRSGSEGSYSYSAKTNFANKPVNFVTLWDAERFANWMHNGQGAGDTETGSYTLLGGTPTPVNPVGALTRSSTATWVIPTENEWDKAAYYDPRDEAQGGPPGGDHYWLYPTASDSVPTQATANAVGDINNPGSNVANYLGAANWNGVTQGNVTSVGSAGSLSSNYYGTFDQGGNVAEWSKMDVGTHHLVLGGAAVQLIAGPDLLTAYGREYGIALGISSTTANDYIGFRLAFVPEPSSLALAALSLVGLLLWAWQPRLLSKLNAH